MFNKITCRNNNYTSNDYDDLLLSFRFVRNDFPRFQFVRDYFFHYELIEEYSLVVLSIFVMRSRVWVF